MSSSIWIAVMISIIWARALYLLKECTRLWLFKKLRETLRLTYGVYEEQQEQHAKLAFWKWSHRKGATLTLWTSLWSARMRQARSLYWWAMASWVQQCQTSDVVGLKDNQEVTVMVSMMFSGELLFPWVIYPKKTDSCHPSCSSSSD